MAQPRVKSTDRGDDADGAVTVLNIGGVYRQSEQMPFGIGDDMTLTAFDFLTGVIAADARDIDGFSGLTVDDTRSRAGLAASSDARRLHQVKIYRPPKTGITPRIEIALNRRNRRKPLRQCAPLAAGPGDVQERIDNRAKLGRSRATRLLHLRHERLDQCPLPIRQCICTTLPRTAISPASGLRPTHPVTLLKPRQLKRITGGEATQPLAGTSNRVSGQALTDPPRFLSSSRR